MAMTQEESAALMNDATFRGRVKVCCLVYANGISAEASTTPAHNTRFKWAQNCFMNPEQVAVQITPPTVMNVNVQDAGGAAVLDADLQAAVQSVVDAIM
jgi:hypothetical protein